MALQQSVADSLFDLPRQRSTIKRFSANYLLALFLMDALLVQLAFWCSLQLRFVLPFGPTLQAEQIFQNLFIPMPALQVIVAALWVGSFFMAAIYSSVAILHWTEEFQRVAAAHTVAAFCLAGMLYMARIELMRLTYLYFYLLVLASLLGYRVILRIWHRWQGHPLAVRRVVVVGAGDNLESLIQQFQHPNWPIYHIVGVIDDGRYGHQRMVAGVPILGQVGQIDMNALIQRQNIHDVVLALPRQLHGQMLNLLEHLRNLPITLRVIPDYFDFTFRGATISRLGYLPVIELHDSPIDTFERSLKRLIDIIGAGVLLCCVWPLMALVALAIKWEDGGPIFYYAERVGEHGRLFTMYKFRSMVINADRQQAQVNQTDANGHIVHKQANDPRITRVGRFIRRTSLDELPQLFNVLRGDMSLVGPRPELPWLVEQYERWQYRRLTVPQGITGWWQVNGRSNNLMHLNTDQDLYYVENYSLWLDLQILWRTVTVVLRGKGAY